MCLILMRWRICLITPPPPPLSSFSPIVHLRKLFYLLARCLLPRLFAVHSDQGFHYTNPMYMETLKGYGVKQSISRKGNCLDNAQIESFFGHLKDEVEIRYCKSFEEVREMVSKFIEYYNNDRPQWTLKKMTPKEYRCHLLSKSKIS